MNLLTILLYSQIYEILYLRLRINIINLASFYHHICHYLHKIYHFIIVIQCLILYSFNFGLIFSILNLETLLVLHRHHYSKDFLYFLRIFKLSFFYPNYLCFNNIYNLTEFENLFFIILIIYLFIFHLKYFLIKYLIHN